MLILLLYVLAPSPKGVECPFLGRYEISGGLNAEDVGKALAASRPGSENNQDKPTPCDPPGKQYLTVGCNSPDTMEFQSECGTKTVAGKQTTIPEDRYCYLITYLVYHISVSLPVSTEYNTVSPRCDFITIL